MLPPKAGKCPPRGALFLADGLRALKLPVTAPGSPNPCRLLVTVTAPCCLLRSRPPATSTDAAPCSLSQPLSEACGP